MVRSRLLIHLIHIFFSEHTHTHTDKFIRIPVMPDKETLYLVLCHVKPNTVRLEEAHESLRLLQWRSNLSFFSYFFKVVFVVRIRCDYNKFRMILIVSWQWCDIDLWAYVAIILALLSADMNTWWQICKKLINEHQLHWGTQQYCPNPHELLLCRLEKWNELFHLASCSPVCIFPLERTVLHGYNVTMFFEYFGVV